MSKRCVIWSIILHWDLNINYLDSQKHILFIFRRAGRKSEFRAWARTDMCEEARARVKPQNQETQEMFDRWEESVLLRHPADRRVVVDGTGAARPLPSASAPNAASSPAGAAAPSGSINLFVDPGQGPLVNRCDACGRFDRDVRVAAGSTADSKRKLEEAQRNCNCCARLMMEAERRRDFDKVLGWNAVGQVDEMKRAAEALREATEKRDGLVEWEAKLTENQRKYDEGKAADQLRITEAFQREHPPLEPPTPAELRQMKEVRRQEDARDAADALERRRRREIEATGAPVEFAAPRRHEESPPINLFPGYVNKFGNIWSTGELLTNHILNNGIVQHSSNETNYLVGKVLMKHDWNNGIIQSSARSRKCPADPGLRAPFAHSRAIWPAHQGVPAYGRS